MRTARIREPRDACEFNLLFCRKLAYSPRALVEAGVTSPQRARRPVACTSSVAIPARSSSGACFLICTASRSGANASSARCSGKGDVHGRSTRLESGNESCHRKFFVDAFFPLLLFCDADWKRRSQSHDARSQWATHDDVSDAGSATRPPVGVGCEVRNGIRKLVCRCAATTSVDTERW